MVSLEKYGKFYFRYHINYNKKKRNRDTSIDREVDYFEDDIKHIPGTNIQIPDQINQICESYFDEFLSDERKTEIMNKNLALISEIPDKYPEYKDNRLKMRPKRTFRCQSVKNNMIYIYECDLHHKRPEFICGWLNIEDIIKIYKSEATTVNNFALCMSQFVKNCVICHIFPSIANIIVEYYGIWTPNRLF